MRLKIPKISIVIPCYEMYGLAVFMLKRCIISIKSQTFTDYEIIISDNSKNDDIYFYCKGEDIRYIYNPIIGNSANRNSAMRVAKGELIKMLDQDDYFADENSLQDIIDNFKSEDNWMMTGCSNNPHPYYSKVNTLGSPTVMTIRNGLNIWFNENLQWTLDLDFYRRMYEKYGKPKILDKINIIIGLGKHQATNHLSNEIKQQEDSRFTADSR